MEKVMKPLAYQGSKRKHAEKLFTAMAETLELADGSLFGGSKKMEHFYEPFGGSLSMSLKVLERFPGVKIEASDASPIIDFYTFMRECGEYPQWLFEWVSREDFKKLPPLLECSPEEWWKRYQFSFSGSLSYYWCAPEKEPSVEVVWKARRDLFLGKISKYECTRRIKEQEKIHHSSGTFIFKAAVQIEERGGFRVPEAIEISKKSYEEMSTPLPGGIVYLDPPYRNTQGYGFGFSVEDFDDWASSIEAPVFISEYSKPEGPWKEIFSFEAPRGNFKGAMKNKSTERLFWNGIGL